MLFLFAAIIGAYFKHTKKKTETHAYMVALISRTLLIFLEI